VSSIKQPAPKRNELKSGEKGRNIVKYSGLGFQLVIVCLGLIFGGRWLDSYFGFEYLFVLIGLFVAVFSVIYILIRSLK